MRVAAPCPGALRMPSAACVTRKLLLLLLVLLGGVRSGPEAFLQINKLIFPLACDLVQVEIGAGAQEAKTLACTRPHEFHAWCEGSVL